jgi:hypothetical protein
MPPNGVGALGVGQNLRDVVENSAPTSIESRRKKKVGELHQNVSRTYLGPMVENSQTRAMIWA